MPTLRVGRYSPGLASDMNSGGHAEVVGAGNLDRRH